MFGPEPQEQWNTEDVKEFEEHVAARHKQLLRAAAWAGMALLIDILALRRLWRAARFIVIGNGVAG